VTRYEIHQESDARKAPKRLALLRRDTTARLAEDEQELETTAPHLLLREVILIQLVVVFLSLCSLVFDAPLEGIADSYHTPNPAKAPWYFVGLQELLHYFPPVVAGVLIPGLIVVALAVIPYFRSNAEIVGFYERPWRGRLGALSVLLVAITALLVAYRVWPVLVPTLLLYLLLLVPALPFAPAAARRRLSRIPLADWIMVWFVAVALVLTLIGVLFRGPGWSWSWPWREGIY
jgi:quinol-cytochrome oxidoreductase complex cytochrome b subunit